jgi:ABC-type polysaccharide/polyol phosphate export permease
MLGVAADFGRTITNWHTWWLMASQDIKLRYRRSFIGPFWISAAMAVQVVGIGLLFAQIFMQPLDSYLLYVASGFLVWGLLSAMVLESCTILIDAESHLRALRIPTPVLAAKMVSKHVMIFFHNLVVIGCVMVFLGLQPTLTIFWAIPGLALLAAIGYFLAIVMGPLCLRFRDVTQVVATLIGIAFFITPIIWRPDQGRVDPWVVQANPLFHFIEVIRAPLMGEFPSQMNWLVTGGAVGLLAVLAVVSIAVSRRRIYFWL